MVILVIGTIIGIIGKMSEKTLVDTFVDGTRDMLRLAIARLGYGV